MISFRRSPPNRPRETPLRDNLLAILALVAIIGGHALMQTWDEQALQQMTAEAVDRGLTRFAETGVMTPYLRVDKHCRVPGPGQVLHMRHDATRGFECIYYTNVGYARAPVTVGVMFSREAK